MLKIHEAADAVKHRSRLMLPPLMQDLGLQTKRPFLVSSAAGGIVQKRTAFAMAVRCCSVISVSLWIHGNNFLRLIEKVFRKLQTLALVVRPDALAICLSGHFGETFEDESANALAMLEDERDFA